VARLKEKAAEAEGGLYHSVKFDFGSFSSSEKEAFRHFLAGTYTQKLGLSGDHATFAATKAEVIQQLSKAFDQDDPDAETYDWPFPIVDILHCSQYQAHLASYVKEKRASCFCRASASCVLPFFCRQSSCQISASCALCRRASCKSLCMSSWSFQFLLG
jgi:hypothetical protein